MDGLRLDLTCAVRSLRRQPVFAVFSILILGIGIGSTTGAFTLVKRTLLDPAPGVERPGEMVALGIERTGESRFSTWPHPFYEDLRARVGAFSGAVARSRILLDLSGGAVAERIPADIVSGNFFEVLGVRFATGRGFLPEETATVGGPLVAVLSYATWLQRFGGDPGVVGAQVRLNGQPFTVVGIAAPEFHGLSVTETAASAWVPLSTQPVSMPADWSPLTSMGDSWLEVYARLAPGASVGRARAECAAYLAELRRRFPQMRIPETYRIRVSDRITIPHPGTRSEVRTSLGLMLVAVTLTLLVVCANLGSLSLNRALGRQREIGIRMAIGSGRGRIVRQLLAESTILALLGGGLGLLVAGWVARLFLTVTGDTLVVGLGPDIGVALFAAAVSMLAVVLFGLAPALHASRSELALTIGEATPGSARNNPGLRKALIVVQVALSVVLVVGAGLFGRSLRNVRAIDPGFDAEHVLVASLDLRTHEGTADEGRALFRGLLERLAALPGVAGASVNAYSPFSGAGSGGGFLVEGRAADPGVGRFDRPYNRIGARYFETLGVPVMRGREFTEADAANAPPVVIVTESFAHDIWPGEDPIGKRIRRRPDSPWMEVVGVVPDTKYYALDEEPDGFFYMPFEQTFGPVASIVVRTAGDPRALAGPVREALAAIRPDLPFFQVGALANLVDRQSRGFRAAAMATGAFGFIALVLAALGLYGLLSGAVSQRRREIGIRIALGARAGAVQGLITRQGMILTVAGITAGCIVAGVLTRFVHSLLFGVSPMDPVAFAGAALALGLTGLVACWIPARRASRVDPAEALRRE